MKFREGTLADGLSILADLREQQCRSLKKLGIDPVVLLHKTLERGPSVTVLIDDRPAAMYGVQSETMLGQQKIWVITTPLVEREPIAFLRNSRRILLEFYETYGTLIGMVDAEFERSCAWLKWCGFVETRRGRFIEMRYSGGH
jgi:hypothetical protein